MPTYVYKFVDTGETIEVQQAFTDDTLTTHPHPSTGEAMAVKKVFQPVGVTFKGSGFYKTDSRGGSAKSTTDTGSKDSGGSDSGDTSSTSTTSSDGTTGSSSTGAKNDSPNNGGTKSDGAKSGTSTEKPSAATGSTTASGKPSGATGSGST